MKNRYQCGVWLTKNIGWDTFNYLPEDVKRLFYDWKILDEMLEHNNNIVPHFFDYSFMIASIYKAVEGTLWKIAEDLEITNKTGTLGSFFNDENLEKIYPKIESSGLSKGKIKELKHELSELKTFLKRYRHNPAHFGSRFKSFEESQLAANSALHNIKCLIQDLLQAGLIANGHINQNSDKTVSENITY